MPTGAARRLCSLLGIRYPMLQAPVGGAAGSALAAAVSNAGAMGGLALTWMSEEQAVQTVREVRRATPHPFLVNYVLSFVPASLQAVLDAGAPVVQFSWGIPSRSVLQAVRTTGARMGIQVANALGARAAMDAGADYLVCQGIEAGGHVQSSMPLRDALAAVLDVAAETPVLAAGGIGDGHDLKRVLDAGASGAVLGTRFVATRESLAHGVYKDALVRAAATDTVLTLCFDGGWPQALHRIIRNGTFNLWEAAGCPAPGQRPGEGDVVAHRRGAAMPRYWSDAPLAGDDGAVGDLPLYAGTSVDRVHDEPTVSELVQRLWSECRHP